MLSQDILWYLFINHIYMLSQDRCLAHIVLYHPNNSMSFVFSSFCIYVLGRNTTVTVFPFCLLFQYYDTNHTIHNTLHLILVRSY